MAESIVDGVRIKFHAQWVGTPSPTSEPLAGLAAAVRRMEELGCCPVLDDGKSAGNGAMVVDQRLFVTASGRRPGIMEPEDLVEVVDFDSDAWAVQYRSVGGRAPTSDTPLYWTVLRAMTFDAAPPRVALHGHVLDTEQAARLLNLPLSHAETEFSTLADCVALRNVVVEAPWPAHRTWIRRGHGFFTVGATLMEASTTVAELATRARHAELL